MSTLASIHEFVLQDCHHIPWAGGLATNSDTKSESKDSEQHEHVNEAYARDLLAERIALENRQVDVAMSNEVFVGPTTYDRFLHCFMSLLKKKEGQIKNLLNDSRYSNKRYVRAFVRSPGFELNLRHCRGIYGGGVFLLSGKSPGKDAQ